MKWYEKFLADYSSRMNRYLEEGEFKRGPEEHRGYFKNRERFAAKDTAGELEKSLFRLSSELGDKERAAEIRRGLVIDLLGLPAARDLWLAEARTAAKAGNRDEALAAYLRSIKPARTVLPEMKGKHPVNQGYLDALRQPQSETELKEIFDYISTDGREDSAIVEDSSAAQQSDLLFSTWKLYWQHERDGLRSEARASIQNYIDQAADVLDSRPHVRLFVTHALVLSHQQEGLHLRAIPLCNQLLDSMEENKSLRKTLPSVYKHFKTTATYSKALSYFRVGDYETAAKLFSKVPSNHRSKSIPQAVYRLGQCYEFLGEFKKAGREYAKVSSDEATDHRLRSLAAFQQKRLKTLVGSALQREESSAIYIGENRADYGNWRICHPGKYGFILFGMQGPFDVIAVPGDTVKTTLGVKQRPMSYQISTTDVKEGGRRWISQVDDPSPSALWDPIRQERVASNLDDFGEQYAVGKGPDLILELKIPVIPGGAPAYRLSFAFSNDHNFYEPNRSYTLHLRDAGGRLLTGCAVEDALCTVYKHFAVKPGQTIRAHVSRDLSLNTLLSGIMLDPLSGPAAFPDTTLEYEANQIQAADLGRRIGKLQAAYDDVVSAWARRPIETRTDREAVWQFLREVETALDGATKEDRRIADEYVSWLRWQVTKSLAVSGEEEHNALRYLANAMVSRIGLDGFQEEFLNLRQDFVSSAEIGRAVYVDALRLELLLPSLSADRKFEEILKAALWFYSIDRGYTKKWFSKLLQDAVAVTNIDERKKRLEKLEAYCKGHSAWALSHLVYKAMGEHLPLEVLGKAYYWNNFRVLSYEGKNVEALARIKKNLEEQPNSKIDLYLRLQLVAKLLEANRVREAVKANDDLLTRHPGHASAVNLEFNLGITLLQQLNDVKAGRMRLERVIRDAPKSYWAKQARIVLEQHAEGKSIPQRPPSRNN